MENPLDAVPRLAAEPAAPGWRLVALTYDLLPLIPLLFVVSALFLWVNGGATIERQPALQWAASLAYWAAVGAYFVVSWRRGGQTIGMRPWRLRVVGANGGPPSVGALWLRYAVATVTPVVGLLWAFLDHDRRALYDLVAGTAFVRLAK